MRTRLGSTVRMLRTLGVCVVGFGLWTGSPASAAAPACRGADEVERLKQAEPSVYQRIVDEAAHIPNGEALLWKIEGKAGKPSYLFGTIHITDERVHRLSDTIRSALGQSKVLAVEIVDDSPEAMAQVMLANAGLYTFTDGSSLETLLTADELAQLTTIAERMGMPAMAVPRMRPWILTLMMALPACEIQRVTEKLPVLDQMLRATAETAGKPVSGLETAEEQLRIMAATPLADQVSFLKATLKLYGKAEDQLETMVQLYLTRRLPMLWPWYNTQIDDPALKEAISDFQLRLIDERNVRMRDRSQPLIDAGGAFIAVGALHLSGPKGLVALYRESGYTVTPVE